MHPVHTLRRPLAPPAARTTPLTGARLGRWLLRLLVLAPLAWGVYETGRDVARFLQ